MQHVLQPAHHYIRFSISPPTPDALTLRKAVQDALTQSFGLTSSAAYVDVLWVDEAEGKEAVFRVAQGDAAKVMAAVVTSTHSPRLSVIQDSSFLPSLLVENDSDEL